MPIQRFLRRATELRALWLSLFLVLIATLVYLYRDVQPLRCPIKLATGIDCPGCGSMRAFYALVEGRWLDALQVNALAVVAYFILGLMLILKVIDECWATDWYRRLFVGQMRVWHYLILFLLVVLYQFYRYCVNAASL